MNNTKKNITLQALKFFVENDYDRASLNNIAEAMGVTKGAIYHYFKNKDELFEECISFVTNSIDSFYIQMIPENPTVKFLLKTLLKNIDVTKMIKEAWGIYIKFDAITFTNIIYSGIKKFPGMKERFVNSYAQVLAMLEGLIIKEQAEGIIKKSINPRLTALEIVTMSEGGTLMLEFYSDDDNKIFQNYADEFWDRLKV